MGELEWWQQEFLQKTEEEEWAEKCRRCQTKLPDPEEAEMLNYGTDKNPSWERVCTSCYMAVEHGID